jgi:diguanylate cyclase (GGDEF)-like protein
MGEREERTRARWRRPLTSLRDPKDVIAEGTQAITDLFVDGSHRAAYLRVHDGVVVQEAVLDDAGPVPTSYLLRDDPYLDEVLESGRPTVRVLDPFAMGPTMRSGTDTAGVTTAAFIPIRVDGHVHGVIRIGTADAAFPDEVVVRCHALGNTVELALGNAIAHQELEMQANTDPLTGLANRRGLGCYLEGDRRRKALSVLVLTIDNLKAINDGQGHDVGDRVLVSVARASSAMLREGDLLARIGGDEFVAVVADADESVARRVACRIEAAVSQVKGFGRRVSVSIGYASCGRNGDIDRVRQQADEAMDEARRVNRRLAATSSSSWTCSASRRPERAPSAPSR